MLKLVRALYHSDKQRLQIKYRQIAILFMPLVIFSWGLLQLNPADYGIINYLLTDVLQYGMLVLAIQLIIIITTNFKYDNQQIIGKALFAASCFQLVIIDYRLLSLFGVRDQLLTISSLTSSLNHINQIITINGLELVILIVVIIIMIAKR